MEFWCCLRNGPFQEIDAKYCIPYMSWFSFISDHASFYFVICLKKHVELPGRNLVQLRDRRAVGDNWREDFIQDCWSLRIGIVTSLILRWYDIKQIQKACKSPDVSFFVAVTSQHFLIWMHVMSIWSSYSIWIGCICFPWNRWEHWKSEKMQQRFCRLRETSRRPCPSSVCCEGLQKVDGYILLTRLLQLLSGADRCFSAIFAHCCILTIIQQCRDISMHYSSFLILDSRITPLFHGSAFQKWIQDILGSFAF